MHLVTNSGVLLCPKCGCHEGNHVIYGYPGAIAMAASQRGLLALGGCMVDRAHLNRQCVQCEHRWECHEQAPLDWTAIEKAVTPNLSLKRVWLWITRR